MRRHPAIDRDRGRHRPPGSTIGIVGVPHGAGAVQPDVLPQHRLARRPGPGPHLHPRAARRRPRRPHQPRAWSSTTRPTSTARPRRTQRWTSGGRSSRSSGWARCEHAGPTTTCAASPARTELRARTATQSTGRWAVHDRCGSCASATTSTSAPPAARPARGTGTPLASGTGRIRAGGVEADVDLRPNRSRRPRGDRRGIPRQVRPLRPSYRRQRRQRRRAP